MLRVRFYLADQNPQRDRTRGISVYTDRLLEALRTMPDLRLSALTSRSSYQPAPGSPEIAVHELPFRTDGPCRRLVADHLHLALTGLAGADSNLESEPDVWHFPKGFLPALQRPRQPVVGTVHDTILEHYATHHPKHRSAAANSYWLGLLARSLARFDLVLTDSEFSRRSIESFCERRRITCPRLEVTYLAARWNGAPTKAEAVEDRVVHLVSPLPHKRSNTALEFWRELQSEQRDLPMLDLIGGTSAEQRIRIAALRGVRSCEAQPDDELKRRISSARALLLPSEIEGFGLPALEAYGLGTPVLYVRGTAVEEVLGQGTPGGFELESFDSFRAALDEVLNLDEDWVHEKSAALRERYSWRACAERSFRAYQGVA
jgi:glycosyltransferase involved in cell wall biosynthesis